MRDPAIQFVEEFLIRESVMTAEQSGGLRQTSGVRLGREFFARDTVSVAKELLGKRLVHREGGQRLSGEIVETEAYRGRKDLGCHGRSGRTARNASMWGAPGHAYVYFNYGMHWLLNLVTEEEGVPAAVLLRSLRPQEGLDVMGERRKGRPPTEWTNGPAKLCQALGIDGSFDGIDLCSPSSPLFVEVGDPAVAGSVSRHPRVGLNSVPEPWKSMPWNFRLQEK